MTAACLDRMSVCGAQRSAQSTQATPVTYFEGARLGMPDVETMLEDSMQLVADSEKR